MSDSESSWPLISDKSDEELRREFSWVCSDPLDLPELPPLIFPRPLRDKVFRDDK